MIPQSAVSEKKKHLQGPAYWLKRGHNAENILSTPLEGGTAFETTELNVYVLLLLLAYYIDALLLEGVHMYVCIDRARESKKDAQKMHCTSN